jgi:hypothetical protein
MRQTVGVLPGGWEYHELATGPSGAGSGWTGDATTDAVSIDRSSEAVLFVGGCTGTVAFGLQVSFDGSNFYTLRKNNVIATDDGLLEFAKFTAITAASSGFHGNTGSSNVGFRPIPIPGGTSLRIVKSGTATLLTGLGVFVR